MFPGRRPTVNDRVKATGFLTRGLPGAPPAMRPLASPIPPGVPPGPAGVGMPFGASGGKAPNLREGEPDHECMACEHWNLGGEPKCMLYKFDPRPFEVCDSFAHADTKAPSEDRAPMEPETRPSTALPPRLRP